MSINAEDNSQGSGKELGNLEDGNSIECVGNR